MDSPKTKINILIATGIYPPDVGGPGTYAKNLSIELGNFGYEVKIVTYGDDANINYPENVFVVNRNVNILIRYWKFFKQILKLSKDCDLVYILDLVSAGFPAVLISKLRRKKVVFRTGGDFLWEKALQNHWTEDVLREYYKKPKIFMEKILKFFSKKILDYIDLIIFSTSLQADIYERYYKVPKAKIRIISNPLPRMNFPSFEKHNQNYILFAGRLIVMKNVYRLIDAFELIDNKEIKLFIYGNGPEKETLRSYIKNHNLEKRIVFRDKLLWRELREEAANSLFQIFPGLTEISPNQALESISMGEPIILTRENGLDKKFTLNIVTINPLSVEDIKEKINYLLNPENLEKYTKQIKETEFPVWDWPQVAKAHDLLFRKVYEENHFN